MRRLATILHLVFALAGCASLTQSDGPLHLESASIKALEGAVFEVVVPKREEDFISYVGRKTLPLAELPFTERNDKYYSIGTAFAIAPGRLVSASHVFQLDRHAVKHEFFVRDAKGRVFAIDKVMRFSQVRDLIELTLVQPPASIRPLPTREVSRVGDAVYSVGNANGEGIAIRDGQIASYTFEPSAGAWKDIRFSAAASPGNSGGPLVNARGEVIGVVVRKNESENLNVAIPIAELRRLSARHAEFFVPSVEANTDNEATKDWHFRTPLPASVKVLADRAESNRRSFHLKQFRAFLKKSKNVVFPRDPLLQDYFWSQTYSDLIQTLTYDDKDGFRPRPKEPEFEHATSRGETVSAMSNETEFSMAQIDVPAGASLTEYVRHPEWLLDAMFEAFNFYREFNGRKIPLASYGRPHETGTFKDPLGRVWLRAVWRTHYNQGTFFLNCLPSPTGFGCTLDNIPTADETFALQEKFETYFSSKVTISYGGSIAAWRRFLAYGSAIVPSFLQGIKIDGPAKSVVRVAAGDFRLSYPQPLYSEKSWLFVGVGYGVREPLKPEIQQLRLDHGAGFPVGERFESYFEPPKDFTAAEQVQWRDLLAGKGQFDGSPRADQIAASSAVYRVLAQKALRNGRKVVQTVACRGPSAQPAAFKGLEVTCDAIKRSFTGTAVAH